MTATASAKPKGFTVRKAGHLVVRVTDPAATAAFFSEVVRFNHKGVLRRGMHFLTSDFADNHHMLLVRPSKEGAQPRDFRKAIGIAGVRYEVEGGTPFNDLIDRLNGYGVTLVTEDEPDGSQSVRFRDADGMPYEFCCRDATQPRATGPGRPFLRTNRLGLRVADVARSTAFYRDVLGFDDIGKDRHGRTLMGANGTVMLALEQAADSNAPRPVVEPDPFIGMEHFAFELAPDDFETLRAFWRHLKSRGVEIHHCVDHIITNSIYFLDPDRNLIEAYINCPRDRFAEMEHPYGTLESLDAALAGEGAPAWLAEYNAARGGGAKS